MSRYLNIHLQFSLDPSMSIIYHFSLPNRYSIYTNQEQELLLMVRAITKRYKNGTWRNATLVYNDLVHPTVKRTQISLKNKHTKMNKQLVQQRIDRNSNNALQAAIERTVEKVIYGGEDTLKHYTLAPDKKLECRANLPRQTGAAGAPN